MANVKFYLKKISWQKSFKINGDLRYISWREIRL